MATSCRESFSHGYYRPTRGAPPNKIRRGSKEEPAASTCNYSRGSLQTELLPLDYAAIRAVPDPLWFLKLHRSFPVQDLSDDVLGICFFSGFVDSIETIRLSRVSKRFRFIASSQVKHLDLRRCIKLDKKKIQNIVSRFQNLTSLDFSYCPQFGREELLCLVPLSRTLKHLGLKGTYVEDDGFVAFLAEVNAKIQSSSLLESIDLSAISKDCSLRVGNKSVDAISKMCPNIKSLKLAWCAAITDGSLPFLAKLSKVSELDLSLTSITTYACPVLREMKQLRLLDVSATKIYNEGAKQMFTETSRLEGLTLRFIEDLTIGSLQLILERAPKLKFLDVTHSGELGDGSIQKTEPFQKLMEKKNILVPGLLLSPSATCRQRP